MGDDAHRLRGLAQALAHLADGHGFGGIGGLVLTALDADFPNRAASACCCAAGAVVWA